MRNILLASATIFSALWLAMVATQIPNSGGGALGSMPSGAIVDGYGVRPDVVAEHR